MIARFLLAPFFNRALLKYFVMTIATTLTISVGLSAESLTMPLQPINVQDLPPELRAAGEQLNAQLALNEHLKTWTQQIDKLQAQLQYLEQALNKGTLKFDNRDAIIAWIQEQRQTLRALHKASFLVPNEKLLHDLLSTNNIILHLNKKALESRFSELVPVNADSLLTRSQLSDGPTLATIAELATSTAQSLTELDVLINDVGLTTANKIFRKIDEYNNDYHVAKIALAAPIAFSILIRALPDWSWKQWISHKVYGENRPEWNLSLWPIPGLTLKESASLNVVGIAQLIQQQTNLFDDRAADPSHKAKILRNLESITQKVLKAPPGSEIERASLLKTYADALRAISEHLPEVGPEAQALASNTHITLFRVTDKMNEAIGVLLQESNKNGSSSGHYATLEKTLVQLITYYAFFQYLRPYVLPKPWNAVLDQLPEKLWELWKEKWHELKGTNFTERRDLYEVIDDITLDDPRLIGLNQQREELKFIANYLLDPEYYIRVGTEIEKGILLVGPSRSGKTFAAKALAGTVNQLYAQHNKKDTFGFREVKYWELWFPDNLKNIIEEAKRNAPCIIFIDEIHNLQLQTTGKTDLLTQFLTTMNDLYASNDPKSQVFIVAATNRPDLLDPALLQHKRFGKIIRFNPPTYEERKNFFILSCWQSAIDLNDVSVEVLARQTSGCSYGDLQRIMNQARIATNNLESVKQSHLQRALDEVIRHLTDTIPLTAAEKRLVATYQAGQALAYYLLNPHEKLESVTIRSRASKIIEINEFMEKKDSTSKHQQHKSEFGALFTYNDNELLGVTDTNELKARAQIACAGILAQDILLGSHSLNYHKDDMQKALQHVKAIVFNGLAENELSKATVDKLNDTALQDLMTYKQELEHLMLNNKDTLIAIVNALESNITLTAEDIAHIVKQLSTQQVA